MTDRLAGDPREEIIQTLLDEMKQARARQGEIQGQVEQMKNFVEREEQRNSEIATQLRIIQENLDTVPRQDIIAKYNEALASGNRITTMRGQLEKVQAQREQFDKEISLLSDLLGKLQGVDMLGSGTSDNGDAIQPRGFNVVRIVQAQEEERQRLARQMHDGPAQSLTNFILQAEICQRLFDRNPERAAEELGNLKGAASITFQKVRDFIFDLRPMMLDDLGVIPTVRRYVESFREKNDIDTRLEILGEERRLQTHREVMLFRGIQELMAHARDYANAKTLSIRLDMSGSRIKVLVEDNGETFNVDAGFMDSTSEGAPPRVQDLITLREKFELVSGSLSVESSEGAGTKVRLELPESDE